MLQLLLSEVVNFIHIPLPGACTFQQSRELMQLCLVPAQGCRKSTLKVLPHNLAMCHVQLLLLQSRGDSRVRRAKVYLLYSSLVGGVELSEEGG